MIGQGLSHGLLRQELILASRGHAGYEAGKSIILFTLRTDDNGADGIAARVLVMRDTGTADEQEADRVTLQNRDSLVNGTASLGVREKKNNYTTAELLARVKAGIGYEHMVHANLSYVCQFGKFQTSSIDKLLSPFQHHL